MKATAKAHTNIALIKYWGKQNQDLIIPSNSSISVTLDQFYTETQVEFDPFLTADELRIEGELVVGKSFGRVSGFMDRVRELTHNQGYARITSSNTVPMAAGLASSASAFAALGAAALSALEYPYTPVGLSRLVRKGSGSACRSVYGGFAYWHAGDDDQSSYAESIECPPWTDFRLIAVVVSKQSKPLGSREAMQLTQQTSPFFQEWVKAANASIPEMLKAIEDHNFQAVGQLSEASAMRMHASLLACDPPQWYFMPESVQVMNAVRILRQQGIEAYFTMDGGPNVKILCLQPVVDKVLEGLRGLGVSAPCVVCKVGEGVHVYDLA